MAATMQGAVQVNMLVFVVVAVLFVTLLVNPGHNFSLIIAWIYMIDLSLIKYIVICIVYWGQRSFALLLYNWFYDLFAAHIYYISESFQRMLYFTKLMSFLMLLIFALPKNENSILKFWLVYKDTNDWILIFCGSESLNTFPSYSFSTS